MRWDAARAASRRQLPKPRKMMAPYSTLGEPKWIAHSGHPDMPDRCCPGCGHHVCSCKPVKRNRYMFPVMVGVETGQVATSTCFSLSDPAECRSDAPADPRPGSVDVAGLEQMRAEWQKDREF